MDLLYMKDKSVKVVALLQRIVQKEAGSCVRRTVEASSGSCNQATEPKFNESLLRVSKCLKECPLGQKHTIYDPKNPILAVVTPAIHRYMKSRHR